MDFGKLKNLHEDGLHDTAYGVFAEMCRETLHGEMGPPSDASHLAHYTTLDTLLALLGVDPSDGRTYYELVTHTPRETAEGDELDNRYLRLYDTFYSNDPNEGDFFVNSADKTKVFRNQYRAVWKLFEERSASPAYLTSLTYVQDIKEVDDLVFWRTYGREGSGCALAFPTICFEGHHNLYRVKYGEEEAAACVDNLTGLLEKYGEIPGAPDFSKMRHMRDIPIAIMNVLSPLAYVHKSKDYDYEKEIRIVIPFSDLKTGLYLQGSSMANRETAWRHFAEIQSLEMRRLFVSRAQIVLGPTVESAANIQFVLKKLLLKRGHYGPDVTKSRISYRR